MSNPLIVSKKNESEHGFRVEKFFNSERNDFDIHVLFNNQIIRKIYLDGEIVKSYSGYCLIHKDLSNACEWMQKAIDLDENNEYTNSIGKTDEFEYFDYNDPVVKALFVASLTFYGKAFTEAQGRRTQLNLD